MTLKLGSTDVSAAYLGSTSLSKLYLGTTEVWSSASPPPVLVQSKTVPIWADPGTATFTSPLTPGNVITVHAACYDASADGIGTPTSASMTFTPAHAEITSTVHASFRNRSWYCINSSVSTAATISVPGMTAEFIGICEWSGVNATVLDVASTAVTSDTTGAPTATFNGGTITPANPASTIVSFIGLRDTSSANGVSFTPPTGFTKLGESLVDGTGLKGALAYGPNATLTWQFNRGAGTGTVGGMIGTLALRPA